MDDLLADFVAESREMLEAIGGEIVAWEAEPGDRARLDAIFRFVHTVKAIAAFSTSLASKSLATLPKARWPKCAPNAERQIAASSMLCSRSSIGSP